MTEKQEQFFMTTAKKTGDDARRLSDLSEDIGIRFQYPNSDRVYIP
ncbi:phosphomethylpyrimidine synthase ThiC, partial [Neisseria sp. P0006.S006]